MYCKITTLLLPHIAVGLFVMSLLLIAGHALSAASLCFLAVSAGGFILRSTLTYGRKWRQDRAIRRQTHG